MSKARRDVVRAKARLKRAEVRAGVQEKAAAAGDVVTTLVTDKVAPAVHDAFADHVVPVVHDVVVERVVPAVRDTLTEKVVPTVRETLSDKVAPAAQKAARGGARRSARLSREAAARIAATEAALEARRRAEAVLVAAAGKPAKRGRRRWPFVLGVLGGAAVLARRLTQKTDAALPTAGPAADIRVDGSPTTAVDLTTDPQATPDKRS